MKRYKIELSTIVEMYAPAESMEAAQWIAQDFIGRHNVNGALSYKLHAIYDTEHEAPTDPMPGDTQQVAA